MAWGRDDTDAYRRVPFRSPYGKRLWDLGREVVRDTLRDPGDDLLSKLLRAARGLGRSLAGLAGEP